MASAGARVTFRVVLAILVIIVFFYLCRPLYWKISATVQEIRENKQTVSGGISQIVYEAQKSVGWYHDESDSGIRDDNRRAMAATARRILRQVVWPLLPYDYFAATWPVVTMKLDHYPTPWFKLGCREPSATLPLGFSSQARWKARVVYVWNG